MKKDTRQKYFHQHQHLAPVEFWHLAPAGDDGLDRENSATPHLFSQHLEANFEVDVGQEATRRGDNRREGAQVNSTGQVPL